MPQRISSKQASWCISGMRELPDSVSSHQKYLKEVTLLSEAENFDPMLA